MNAKELLLEARRRGIKIWAAGERLRYDAPAGAMDRELREALGSNREEVLALLRESRLGPLPLSFAQERLWFMRELAPDSPFYNVPARIRLRGRLDVERLRECFSRLVARHETLRTTFSEEGQRIGEPREVHIPVVDLEDLPRAERDAESARVANEEASRVFDLGRGPLLRARLLRLSRDEHILALTLHHIVSDGWSMNVLLQEVAEIYDALSSGKEPRLPALEIQYADYATWQRERLSGELLERQVELWRRKLENLPALALPSDRPRPAALSYRGGREWLSLPRDLSARVRDLARSEGVTLYATLLSAFLLLLHRYTGEEDVFVGSPFAGRGRRELEGLIGFFVNSLVLRADLSGDPAFRALLSRVAENAREAFAHQEVPFERLVEELEPDRDLGKNPLFQVVFALQNAPETSGPMGGLEPEWGWAETGATRFDLEAHVWDDGSDLRLAFVYSSDLYEASTIRRMERHYRSLLERIVEEPGRRISEIDYLEDVERYRVLVAWNETKTSYPREATIHELFEEQASRRPEGEALLTESGSITYGELDRRTNRLARFLKRTGVDLETRVGVCLDRGPRMIEALLAILKAGGAYVPVDPDLPRERRDLLLEDTKAPVVLTSGEHSPRFRDFSGKVLVVEEIDSALETEIDEGLASGVRSSNLAYILFTSGSTGRPKGVAVPHRGVVRLVAGASFVEISERDSFLQLAPISFDASTFEIWGSLLNGAKLFLYPPETPSLEDLGRTLATRGITTLWLTGTLFHQMVEEEIESLSSVRQIVAGGEALSPVHVRTMLSRRGDAQRLVNGYGPTEGTTFTCCHSMSRTTEIEGSVPIGRPIANTRVYLLDGYGEPVPPGVSGELHLGGDGLAREYFGRPELTAEKFIPDALSGERGARLYRTGDVCRFLEDGSIEFLGREDHQVKVRGFRIELAEVERALTEIPEIAEAVVVAREDEGGKRSLVAYVAPDPSFGRESGVDLDREHVSEWRALFDDTYRSGSPPLADEFDIAGWNSSYSGEAIPAEEMREWVVATVERILAKNPSRVLEIGCGTGLLLYRIAPRVERYVGCDLSSKAILNLWERFSSRADLSRVELFEREASDFTGIEPRSFDTVIVNSVSQYLPSAEYFLKVLSSAVESLSDGGRIFVGDVRSYPLLEAFHASVQRARAGPGVSEEDLQERIARGVEEESELLLSPSFFYSLKRRFPRVSDVEVFVKRGRFQNELTRFRYDVFVHVERKREALEAPWIDWESSESLRAELRRGGALGVRGIPNRRLEGAGPELQALSALAAESGHALELGYSSFSAFFLDALFRPVESIDSEGVFWPSDAENVESEGRESNHPLRTRLGRLLIPRLRRRAQELLPEYMVPSAFVPLERMPVGPTGKVDRKALPSPSPFRADRVSDYAGPRSRVEKTLAAIWADVLGLDRVGVRDNFFELGGDSILGIQIVARAKSAGLSLRVRQIFEHQTVAELAGAVDPGPEPALETPAAVGEVPLTPIQEWFFELDLDEPHHFNQALLLELRKPIETDRLRKAFRRLFTHHDAFRLRFRKEAGKFRQELVAHDDEPPFSVAPADSLAKLQASLDLENGPVARAALIPSPSGGPDRLLFVCHHLIVDGVSWRVLVSDLDRLLTDPDAVLPSTTSFASWARRLRDHAESEAVRGELSFWREQDRALGAPIPRDRAGSPTYASLERVTFELSEEETETLLRPGLESILLRALGEALSIWTGQRRHRVAVEGHGREEILEGVDLSRTVGWFTSMVPVVLDGTADRKETPTRGIGYGLLRYLLRAEELGGPRPEVSFTYLGQLDSMFGGQSLFRSSAESPGPTQSSSGTRPHLLDVTARIQDRRLSFHWYFSGSVHERATIERLARSAADALRSVPSSLEEIGVVEDRYALTPMQRGMLFESFYQPDAGVYVEQYGLELEGMGEADREAFVAAWQRVVDRHPALRTSIAGTDSEEPRQVVWRSAVLPVLEHDLRSRSESEQEAWLEECRNEDRKRGIDLGAAPLMRLTLFRRSEERLECLWTFHHIVLDGWSVPLVLEEVFRFYEALRLGDRLVLPPARRFRDFVSWLKRQDLKKAESFWREKLRGIDGPTPLPLQDRRFEPREGAEEYGEERVVFARETTDGLRSFAARSQVTVNTVVLGAWAMLLSRYSGEEEVVLGTTVSGRPSDLEGVESIVGLFINTLPLRVTFGWDARVGSFLRDLQALQLESREYEYSPLWQVQQWSGLPAGVPLFETFFVFENYPDGARSFMDSSELKGRSKPSVERSGYPLALAASLREELALRLFFDRKRFDGPSVRRLASHLEQIVGGMTRDFSARLSAISILGRDERRLVLEEWNDTGAPALPELTAVELFERAAAQNPDAPALSSEASFDRTLSYGELNRRANRLAHRLLREGLGPETLAGVCFERGVDLVLAKLAILKTGGAYVPLDPDNPARRLLEVVEDARPKAIVAPARYRGLFRGSGVELVDLESEDEGAVEEDPVRVSCPESLAYVIYTSGSTGRPKGVAVSNRSLSNLVDWHRRAYDVSASDRASQIAAPGFDACAWEIWPHLASGASLHFPDEDTRTSPAKLWSWMEDEGITIAFLPTPLAEAAIAETIPETLPLRLLLTGGDRLKSGASPDFPFALVNHYGLTETAVVATAGLVTEASSPPIGRPIARTRMYLLDSSFEPVPIAVKGEMFVGGFALARGYLGDPEKTAEKFVPDPFSRSPGARMFRAGDYGRFLPDGSIEFLGRNDDQIKIRGFRVELAEVERALLEHEAVVGAEVLCREDEPGRKRIVAYYTGEGESGGLSSFLAERLPPHMIPSAFVKLDSFPLTSNGKVDRKRLRAPEPPVPRLEPVLPAGRTESILARIWSEVLRVEVLSVEDDYFELGGDSILSIQIVARARAEGIAITAKDVFQNPTIAALAALSAPVEEVFEEDEEGEAVESEVPLTPIQRWFFEQNFPEPHHFNQAFLFRLRRPIGPDLLRRGVDFVLSHHRAFRLRYRNREGEWRQLRAPNDDTTTFTAFDLSGLRPTDRTAALTERAAEIQRTFSLEAGPLVRAALFDFGEDPGRFLLAAHHLAVDGVSFRILLSDLETVLDQMERLEEPKLPPKTSSFGAWARRLEAHAAAEELSDELDHWARLAPFEPAPLRRDHPRGENRVASLATVSVRSSEEEASRLLQKVPQAYQTRTHEVLLAALVEALAALSGEKKLLLTLEGHGREALFDGVDVSRTVGWFTSLFPVLLDATGARGAGDTLKAVKEQIRSIPARGLGYGLLRHLSPDESVRARLGSIGPEIAFNYLGRFDSVLDGGSRFAFSAEPIGPTRSPLAMRLHLLEVMAVVVEGRLRIDFTFSSAIHRRETIEELASRYLSALRALIDHCLEPEAGGYTPSDFALAGLDQAQLDELLKEKG